MSDPVEDAIDRRDRALRNAGRAKVELDLTEEIMSQMKAALVERWASTSITSVETREKMFQAFRTIEEVRKALVEAVNAGQVEAHARHMADLLSPAQSDRTR